MLQDALRFYIRAIYKHLYLFVYLSNKRMEGSALTMIQQVDSTALAHHSFLVIGVKLIGVVLMNV